jgi:hypothetical protein
VIAAADRERHAQAVAEVFGYMRKHKLTLDDLINIGGEDFRSSSVKRVERARRVESCWSLMARLGIKFADLEGEPSQHTAKPVRRRRGEAHFLQALETTSVSDTFAD